MMESFCAGIVLPLFRGRPCSEHGSLFGRNALTQAMPEGQRWGAPFRSRNGPIARAGVLFTFLVAVGLTGGDMYALDRAKENGDTNGDLAIDLSDPVYLLTHLFLNGPSPVPLQCDAEPSGAQNGDTNGDAALDLSDAIHLLAWLFLGGPEPFPACLTGSGASVDLVTASSVVGRILVRGAKFAGSNGVAFDAVDHLHVASVAGRDITALDPDSGQTIARLGPDEGVEAPDDLAFGPTGDIYETSILTGEVVRVSPEGGRKAVQVPARDAQNNPVPGVNPITFSDDGRLFVGYYLFASGLFELDPDLVDPPREILPVGFPDVSLNAFDFGPDGLLYAPQPNLGRVVRLDVDATPAILEEVAAGFVMPIALKFDSAGRPHVADAGSGDVVRLDLEDGTREVVASVEPGLDNLAFDSGDRLFVSSTWDGFIKEVLPGGALRTVRRRGTILPAGVAVITREEPGPDGVPLVSESAVVADTFRVREFRGLTGERRGELLLVPTALTVSPAGDGLVATSWFGDAIFTLDPDTGAFELFSEPSVPLNAIALGENFVVADVGTGIPRVVLRNQSGVLKVLAAANGVNIFLPLGLAGTEESAWFADWATGIVWQVVAGGEPTVPLPVAFGLQQPEGLAVDPEGGLLVVESGARRLSSIDLETGFVSTLAEGLAVGALAPPGVPPTWIFNGVAVGPSGAIYVTGGAGKVLYRFDRVRAEE